MLSVENYKATTLNTLANTQGIFSWLLTPPPQQCLHGHHEQATMRLPLSPIRVHSPAHQAPSHGFPFVNGICQPHFLCLGCCPPWPSHDRDLLGIYLSAASPPLPKASSSTTIWLSCWCPTTCCQALRCPASKAPVTQYLCAVTGSVSFSVVGL